MDDVFESLDKHKVKRVAVLHLLYGLLGEKFILNSEDPSTLASEITTVILTTPTASRSSYKANPVYG